MKNSRVIDILKSFNDEDIKLFRKFLDSPFINSRRKISLLLDYLIKLHPEYDSSRIEKETIFKKIFPDEKYKDKKISNYITDLTKAAEDYLMHDAIISDDIESLIFTSKGFYKKKLHKHALRIIGRIEKKIEPGFSSEKNYFSIMRKIHYLKGVYFSDSDFQKLNESEHSSFEIAALQFLVDYTWMMCERHTGSGTLLTKSKNNLTEVIAQSFDLKIFLELADKFVGRLGIIAKLHYMILKTIEAPDSSEDYESLKKMFYENISSFDRAERFMLFGHLLNSCGEKIREYRQDRYAEEMYDVYKKMLEHNAYSKSESEYLLLIDYRNLMLLTILYNDADFLEKLYKEYSVYLNPEFKEDIILLSEANFYFLKGDFNKCLEQISKIRNENYIINLDYRMLKLKTYYELGFIEEAFSLIDSHKHYISNTKEISKFTKYSNQKFLKIFSELLKAKTGFKKNKLFSLENEIENVGKYQFKDWFKRKAEELKKS
ncbi:MAG: hypothetical protein HGGPFJEG_01553 [Ignavibacteria bacterium]|nr:hypothetical protein [Ignavibacteria bacterium]